MDNPFTYAEMLTLREWRYRRTPERRVHTVEAARAFVQEVGFCHFWPIADAEMPNLFHAIAGRVRNVPNEHDDPDISACWGWKDNALGKRWWYYGKLLRRRATLIAPELLPAFYACSENFGDLNDYLEEYRAGLLTADAKDIYAALLTHGPLDTIRLRKEARMSAESAKARFERALVELQVGLKVIPVGVAEVGAWRYAFVYELLPRHFPTLPEQARAISRSQAQRTLIQAYVENVIGSHRDQVARIFHVFKWSRAELDAALQALLAAGTLTPVQWPEAPAIQWVARRRLAGAPV